MTKRSNARIIFGVIAMAMSLVLVIAAPALAGKGGKGGKGEKGGNESRGGNASSTYTEDNDTNDNNTPNNVSDDGDNKHPSGKDRSVENGGSGNQGNSDSDPDDDGRGPDRSNGGPDKPNGSGGVDSADQDGNNGCGNDDDFEDDNEGWCGKPDKDDEVKGDGSSADMTIVVDCFSITVTSTKDISYVEVTFASGETVKFDGLDDESFTRTFDEVLASGEAKSGSTVVTDSVDGDCDEAGGNTTPQCPNDQVMGDNGSCSTPPTCPEDDVMGEGTETDCDEVEGEVIDKPEADVLGERITNDGSDVAAEGSDVAAERAAGRTLPFTGASLLAFLGIALGLITSGFLFWRKNRS